VSLLPSPKTGGTQRPRFPKGNKHESQHLDHHHRRGDRHHRADLHLQPRRHDHCSCHSAGFVVIGGSGGFELQRSAAPAVLVKLVGHPAPGLKLVGYASAGLVVVDGTVDVLVLGALIA
jgi:hypothetical protein